MTPWSAIAASDLDYNAVWRRHAFSSLERIDLKGDSGVLTLTAAGGIAITDANNAFADHAGENSDALNVVGAVDTISRN